MVHGKINRDRNTNHLAGRHSSRTNQCPPRPSPIFYRPDALPASQPPASKHRRQPAHSVREKTLKFSSTVLPAPSPYAIKHKQWAAYLQSYRSDAEYHKTLKQRLREAGASSFLTHDDRSELTVIADENQLSTAEHNRTHALRLRGLRALINQHRTELSTASTHTH